MPKPRLEELSEGLDRDSEICAELFDESNAAVLDAIERIIAAACGQHHVGLGAPDAVDATHAVIGAAERLLLLDAAKAAPLGQDR